MRREKGGGEGTWNMATIAMHLPETGNNFRLMTRLCPNRHAIPLRHFPLLDIPPFLFLPRPPLSSKPIFPSREPIIYNPRLILKKYWLKISNKVIN